MQDDNTDDTHDHAHDHDHGTRDFQPDLEDTHPFTEAQFLETALRELLIEKGVITADELRGAIEFMDGRGAHLGAGVVARAWTDPGFKARLLADGTEAVELYGIPIRPTHLVVVENTATVHNVIVCTLCSCYPRNLLGRPPLWYKSREYRSRAVREPRAVLAEFGTTIPAEVEIRVHDSTADMRYL
ncbi:MAG TPA: nitrile hydratase subunit alpha, partial [Alphaproteobacteria bacterium]|nr:nitrile hydratase subunit alpha [Alphaproteobacteria bacterium]